MLSVSSLTMAITYRAEEEVVLPAFAGGLWRGALGAALRDTLCITKELSCGRCFLRPECLYAIFYHNQRTHGARCISEEVKPFVIQAPLSWVPLLVKEDGLLGFSLTLFSEQAWNRLPYLIAALHWLGRRGIGKRRVRLELRSVDLLSPSGEHLSTVYEGGRLSSGCKPSPWPVEEGGRQSGTADIEVEFLTPLRIERQGEPVDEGPPFEEFARALLRRRYYLLQAYSNGFSPADRELEQEEAEILLLCDSVTSPANRPQEGGKWRRVSHYSGREKKRQSLGGLVGKVRYLGVPHRLLPLLRLGVLTHAGKRTTHGLGAYALSLNGQRLAPPFWAAPPALNDDGR